MRLLLALVTLSFSVPAAANGGNSQAPADQSRKSACVRVAPGDSRAPQRVAQRGDCRPAKPVPWVVDPTPLFIL